MNPPQGENPPPGGSRRPSSADRPAGRSANPARPAGTVRIVAGARRNRRLRVPAGFDVRPTSEMVREAIFDALGPVNGLVVLDLFAGTGAMGLEALSRGAARCVFVEGEKKVAGVLWANVRDLHYEEASRVKVVDYRAALQDIVQAGERFDLLFVDPPYRMLTEVEVTLEPVVPSLLNDGAVVVFESSRASHPTLGARPVFDRVYGDTRVTMVTMRRPDPVKTVLCPGTYDPVTIGHLDIITRCSAMFDEVVVAVVDDSYRKSVLFSAGERAHFLQESTKHLPNVRVAIMRGLGGEIRARRWERECWSKGCAP